MDAETNGFEAVWSDVEKLSKGQKAELVKRLLGNESDLILVSTSTHLADYIIAQMSLLSSEGLAYVLQEVLA
jgi:uncharacterized protein YaaW (UPF0174 family)